MSLRAAINMKCRSCIVDTLDAGTAAVQIACCTDTTCALHPVRPITTTMIPLRLLDAWHISPLDLCERARPLVVNAVGISTDRRNGQLADITAAGTG